MVAQSYVRPRLQPGDEIIVSEAEHHANLVPWLMVAGQTGARVVKLPLGADRLPDIASLSALITPRSRVLAIGQMSNVTGGCPDLAQAIRLAHAAGMVVMVDGAQGAVHFPADVQALDIDFYAFSGHKLYGPTGIGALYGKSELLAAMSPWLGGGKMIAEVSFDGFTPQPAPYGLEAGTPNVAGVIGLSAALEWLAQSDIGQAENWSRSLASLAEEALAKRPGFRSFRCQQSSLLAFEFRRCSSQRSGDAAGGVRHCSARRATLRPTAAGGLRGQRHAAGLFRPLQYPRRCCGAGPRGGSRPGNSGGLMTTLHPFGTTITDATLRQTFAPLNQWEDKYRQLILLGKKLPTLTDERKAQAREIAGCENRVWLGYEEDAEGRLHFFGDSEGRIVRGLLAVLLTAVEGKTRAGILAQDPLALFDELGLRGQLSASRSQGLSALSEAVLAAAREVEV